MSLAAEEVARREAELMEKPNEIPVRIKVRWEGSICLPDPEGEAEEKAVFRAMTFGDNLLIEQACRHETPIDEDSNKTQVEVDFNEVRRLTLKRNLLSWSLNIPLERENGWLTPECYKRVGQVPAPLIEAFLDGFWKRCDVDAEEEEMIGRQASVLFGKNSRGVNDACEAVRLYCTMSGQWDKFGLKGEELMSMPYRQYVMLKLMMGYENEAMRRQTASKQPPVTKIAGRGGRTRPSHGTRIPM